MAFNELENRENMPELWARIRAVLGGPSSALPGPAGLSSAGASGAGALVQRLLNLVRGSATPPPNAPRGVPGLISPMRPGWDPRVPPARSKPISGGEPLGPPAPPPGWWSPERRYLPPVGRPPISGGAGPGYESQLSPQQRQDLTGFARLGARRGGAAGYENAEGLPPFVRSNPAGMAGGGAYPSSPGGPTMINDPATFKRFLQILSEGI